MTKRPLTRFVGAIMTELAYGRQVGSAKDEILRISDEGASGVIRLAAPGGNLFPILLEIMPFRTQTLLYFAVVLALTMIDNGSQALANMGPRFRL